MFDGLVYLLFLGVLAMAGVFALKFLFKVRGRGQD